MHRFDNLFLIATINPKSLAAIPGVQIAKHMMLLSSFACCAVAASPGLGVKLATYHSLGSRYRFGNGCRLSRNVKLRQLVYATNHCLVENVRWSVRITGGRD